MTFNEINYHPVVKVSLLSKQPPPLARSPYLESLSGCNDTEFYTLLYCRRNKNMRDKIKNALKRE